MISGPRPPDQHQRRCLPRDYYLPSSYPRRPDGTPKPLDTKLVQRRMKYYWLLSDKSLYLQDFLNKVPDGIEAAASDLGLQLDTTAMHWLREHMGNYQHYCHPRNTVMLDRFNSSVF